MSTPSKPKPRPYLNLDDFLKADPKENPIYERRLPYKNMVLTLAKQNEKVTVKVSVRFRNRTYTKLNIDIKDIDYMIKLLKELKEILEAHGLKLTYIL